ncbi:MAG: hypothetical protein PWP43_47 [Bacillota bacterium]|nr:hypothetical protein [Bacillota bacterium]
MTGQPGKFDKIILFISVALILSIALNLNQYHQLGKLTQKMNQLMSEVSYIRMETQNQAQDIRSSLAEFREEQRWVTPVEIHPSLTDEGKALTVLLTWQVKEYEEGSPVGFFYRRQGEQAFASLAAENVGGNTFQVKFPIDGIPHRPAFRIHFNVKNPSGTNDDKKAEEAKPVKPDLEGPGYLYDYYINVRQGGQVRSTELSRLDLGKLALYHFSPVTVQIEEDQRRGELHVSIYEEGPVEPQHRLAGAYLEVYPDQKSGDGNPAEISLKKGTTTLRYAEREVPVYEASFQGETKSLSRIVARVEYEDGQVFRHQIWP